MAKSIFLGAPGANAGTEFHELWALLQALELINPHTELTSISMESVASNADTSPEGTWDGVDVACYYGGFKLESCQKAELIQLKYSASNPEMPWTAARLTSNTAKNGNNSDFRKLADAAQAAKALLKNGSTLKVRFISNQPMQPQLLTALRESWESDFSKKLKNEESVAILSRLRNSTNLSLLEFRTLLNCLDFSECGLHSRFEHEAKLISAIEKMTKAGPSIVGALRTQIRKLMLPESQGRAINRYDVLGWFNVSSMKALFPCPPEISTPKFLVKRTEEFRIEELLNEKSRIICIHGEGGSGKTTLLTSIATLCPADSIIVSFDCYGSGKYIFKNDERHLPKNAFLQLINDLAVATKLPIFIPSSAEADAKLFLERLEHAAVAYKEIHPLAKIVIAIDAADNSVAAARANEVADPCFVHDILRSDLRFDSENVKFVLTSRTSRMETLDLPKDTVTVDLAPFDHSQVEALLRSSFPSVRQSNVEQMLLLSGGNPRVITYAIDNSGGNEEALLASLRPKGKTLAGLLKTVVETAASRFGNAKKYADIISALAYLPPPIDIACLSRVTSISESVIRDILLDLKPGIRFDKTEAYVSDEDFEEFIHAYASNSRKTTETKIAEDMLAHFKTDGYCAVHVLDSLLKVDRTDQILSVIETDAAVNAINDQFLKRNVQIRRLQLAVAASSQMSNLDFLKTLLISAEALMDRERMNDILWANIGLATEFSDSAVINSVLFDKSLIGKRGSFLVHDAARASRAGDRSTVYDQLHFYDAWLDQRADRPHHEVRDWVINDSDLSARFEGIEYLRGPKIALTHLLATLSRDKLMSVGCRLLQTYCASGRSDAITEVLESKIIPGPFRFLAVLQLAEAGEPYNVEDLYESLSEIKPAHIPKPESLSTGSHNEAKQIFLRCLLDACELAYSKNDERKIALKVATMIEFRLRVSERGLYGFEAIRLDALVRSKLLIAQINSAVVSVDMLIGELHGPAGQGKKPNPHQRERDTTSTFVKGSYDIYIARLEVLTCEALNQRPRDEIYDELFKVPQQIYQFDYNRDTFDFRRALSESVLSLISLSRVDAGRVFTAAAKLSQGRYEDQYGIHRARLWRRFRARKSEQDKLILFSSETSKAIISGEDSATSKHSALIQLAELVFPISRSDSKALFNMALKVASEIDHEALAQISFLERASHRTTNPLEDSDSASFNLAGFAVSAAKRLDGHDFNWDHVFTAISSINPIAALSVASILSDNGTVRLSEALDVIIRTAIASGRLSVKSGVSLVPLLDGMSKETLKAFGEALAKQPAQENSRIVEYLASDIALDSDYQFQKASHELSKTLVSIGDVTLPFTKSLQSAAELIDEESKSRKRGDAKSKTENLPGNIVALNKPLTNGAQLKKIIEELRKDQKYGFEDAVLEKLRELSNAPTDRLPFLRVVSGSAEIVWSSSVSTSLAKCLKEWKSPAVDEWRATEFPEVLVSNFSASARLYAQGDNSLEQLLELTSADGERKLNILKQGVAKSGTDLSGRTRFGLSALSTQFMSKDDVAKVFSWYCERLFLKVPFQQRTALKGADYPNDQSESISRLLFTKLGDPDARIRWRAAHCLRRFAKLERSVLDGCLSQLNRVNDHSFADRKYPFRFLSSRLWLMLAAQRIANETPSALTASKKIFFDLCTDKEFPHAAIREYAKRTILTLTAKNEIALSLVESRKLRSLNIPRRTTKVERSYARIDRYGDGGKTRFSFDSMDSLPYWYDPALRIFPLLKPNDFISHADAFIVDTLKVDPETVRDLDIVDRRFTDDRSYSLTGHRHGSLPTVERYQQYLEWHALQCVVGKLVQTSLTYVSSDGYGDFEYWLKRWLPTNSNYWASDLRGPVPPLGILRDSGDDDVQKWIASLDSADLLVELSVEKNLGQDWMIVDGSRSLYFGKRYASVHVTSALIKPEKAADLLKAITEAKHPYDIYLPFEGDDDDPKIELLGLSGCIKQLSGELEFDSADPKRASTSTVREEPGENLRSTLSLHRNGRRFFRTTGNRLFSVYGTWGDKDIHRDRHFDSPCVDGSRLRVRKSMLIEALRNSKYDLVCRIIAQRSCEQMHARADIKEGPLAKEIVKAYAFRRDGSYICSDGSAGTWFKDETHAD